MEVSQTNTGLGLLEEMAGLTGLPAEMVVPELKRLAVTAGLDLHRLTLDDLRPVLLQFLSEMVLTTGADESFAVTH